MVDIQKHSSCTPVPHKCTSQLYLPTHTPTPMSTPPPPSHRPTSPSCPPSTSILPLGRLIRCRDRLDSMKKGPHVFVAIFAFWLTVTFCPQWLLIWLQEVYASRCSLILSTVGVGCRCRCRCRCRVSTVRRTPFLSLASPRLASPRASRLAPRAL